MSIFMDSREGFEKVGASPGTVTYVGKERREKVKITLIDYSESKFLEQEITKIEDLSPYQQSSTITWVDVSGVHNTNIIEEIGEKFSLHPLTLEDIANTTQRPKIDEYEEYLFLELKIPYYKDATRAITVEQISLVVGEKFVISFQEKEEDILEPLRYRIRNAKGKIRKLGSDYLAYAIIDSIIDHYFVILEQFDEDIAVIEQELMEQTRPEILNTIYKLKRELIFLHKSIWPVREVVGNLQRGGYKLIGESLTPYLRDLYDHTIQTVETLETFRDTFSGMLELYLSSVSNKLNEVMKVLTIFAAIFIPLTFIAGVYGMNFKYMPELGWRWGYLLVWGVMGAVVLVMVGYFKKNKWM